MEPPQSEKHSKPSHGAPYEVTTKGTRLPGTKIFEKIRLDFGHCKASMTYTTIAEVDVTLGSLPWELG